MLIHFFSQMLITGTDAKNNRKSVFSRKWTLSNIDRRGLSQVSCWEWVDVADITVHLLGRAIHPYTGIYIIRWFMLKTGTPDRLSEGQEVLFSAPQHKHWGVPVEHHVCNVKLYYIVIFFLSFFASSILFSVCIVPSWIQYTLFSFNRFIVY